MPAPKIAAARLLAFDILRKVEAGGYASDLLLTQTAALDSRDAGLAAEIVFGVLRYRAQLDYLITHYAGKPRKLDLEVRIALRMGIYQLRYLERVPAHAAVKESVELVKRARKTSAAGFVNAILRQVDRDPVAWPTREIELSCPEWLLARWERHYGAGSGRRDRARRARRAREVRRISAASAAPGHRLAVHRAAARALARPDVSRPLRRARQQDRAGARSRRARGRLRPPLPPPRADEDAQRRICVVLDGTRPLPFCRPVRPHPGGRAVLAAPAPSARNPEIKWRLTPAISTTCSAARRPCWPMPAPCSRPAASLVYSTCSLEPEENEGVVATRPRAHRPNDAAASRARRRGRLLRCCDKIGEARK